ncbi:hypothetical protein VDS42_19125 [Xanthomonas campestris pv. campestris]|nr:hypothetical protein [Xanthomonas campestris pv. campestris]
MLTPIQPKSDATHVTSCHSVGGDISTKRDQLDKAAQLGAAAFAAGKMCVSAHDPAVLLMLKGRRVGETPEGEAGTVEILKAWSGAWVAANLAAPLFDADDLVHGYSRAQAITITAENED